MTATGSTAPRASVCIPAYRDGPAFRAALASAQHQTVEDLEIIVSDDSGGDLEGTASSSGDPRVVYLRNEERLGFSGNHCRALEAAHGDHVAILQHDDEWDPRFLELAIAALERDPAAGFVITGIDDIDAAGEVMGPRPSPLEAGRIEDPLAWFLRRDFMLMLPSAMVFRREALADDRRPWPDHGAADMTLYLDLLVAGWQVQHVPDRLSRYRSHDEQLSANPVTHRAAAVEVFAAYHFPDLAHESARRLRLAQALVARAGSRVRAGDGEGARVDLLAAARARPGADLLRWTGLWPLSAAASLTPQLVPALHRAWSRLHDPVATRHGG